MIYYTAIYDPITKVLNFHLGAGLGDDLFDPGEYDSLARHGTGCDRLLHHKLINSWYIKESIISK